MQIYSQINFNALIIPGKGAAGLDLGIKRENISPQLESNFMISPIGALNSLEYPIAQYHSPNVELYFRKGVLIQIGVKNDYAGKLSSGLGLNDLICDFEKTYGKVTEGEEDELVFENLNELWFEIAPKWYEDDDWHLKMSSLFVKELYVYNKALEEKVIWEY